MTTYTDASATVRDVGHVTAALAQPPQTFLGRFENSVYLLDNSFTVDGTWIHESQHNRPGECMT